jgi:uncharacterized membrane protein YjgN (DUF898 family)
MAKVKKMSKKMLKKNQAAADKVVSKFDGKLRGRIGTGILQLLVIAIMGGIGYVAMDALGGFENVLGIAVLAVCAVIGLCWARIIALKWKFKHTIVSNHRLKFKASALGLFFNIIKWILLTVLTVGIYAFWLPIKVKNWRSKHTTAKEIQPEVVYNQPQVTFYTY